MKIVYGIMESHKNRELTEFSLSTWINFNDVYIFTDKCNDNDERFIKITERDDYHSNAIKCILGLRFMYEKHSDFDFFVFIDNDTHINVKNLNNFLLDKKNDELKSYGSILNNWPTDKSLYYLSGGAGIILTNRSMVELYKILENDEKIFECTNSNCHNSVIYDYSDVLLGYHMRNIGVELINSNLFHSQPPDFYNDEIKNSISYHYINTIEKMKKINEL